jgi:hypothetical protein
MSKKRRKNGSLSRGFSCCTVPRVAMFTTAGVTFFSIGASDGTGVSPTAPGSWATATDGAASGVTARSKAARLE